jgi:flagellar hook protein FlgE
MGLQTTMTTSLTGMTAAETTIDVVGNNVANANTVGFKESSVSFATQFLQTQSIGSAPTGNRGGTNPRQVGLGVKVAEITPDFTQGTVQISANPLDLAIQGEGFFIVQGPQGEAFYTRNGQFKTNANNEIVTITGHRVMGYSVDANFEIQPTGLTPLSIPLGAAAVAQATENVTMEGNLNPNDDVGDTPEIIQSSVLSDGSQEFPATIPTGASLQRPDLTIAGTTVGAGDGSSASVIAPGDYTYKFMFIDSDGNEGPASAASAEVTVTAGNGDEVNLGNIPQPTGPDSADFTGIRIYRSDAGSTTTFRRVGQIASGTTAFVDTAAAGTTLLNDTGLSSNSYQYYITFAGADVESRPSALIPSVTADAANNPRIRLDGIPAFTSPDYDRVRIYRNLATNPETFHLVDEIAGGVSSYIDSTPDSAITSNPTINLEGPPIFAGLALTEVRSRDGSNYVQLFQEGELSFTGTKAGRVLAERTLTITATTTVQDLIGFMEQAMGVVETADEDTFPTPAGGYGGRITDDGRLSFTSNMGVENALEIDLSAFRLTPTATGVEQSVGLEFDTTQEANGQGSTADVIAYDSIGTQVRVTITTVVEHVDSTGARFRWIATSPDHQPATGFSTVVGTGVITTDANGKFVSASEDRVAIDRGDSPAVSPLDFQFDFSKITGLDDETAWAAGVQDGLAAGTLTSFIITDSGLIQGVFSNGSSRDLGQVRMARFANNGGLEQLGDNLFQAGVNSGLPIQGDPGSQGIGSITAGAVELSNTDIGQNLIELILASTQYRGGARVITAVQELLDELLALRR